MLTLKERKDKIYALKGKGLPAAAFYQLLVLLMTIGLVAAVLLAISR